MLDICIYILPNGTLAASGWLDDGGNWYLFDFAGRMLTGWQKDNDLWYYLTPYSGMGLTQGAMQTGWIQPGDGKAYWLNDGSSAALPYGAMLASGTTPDGHVVSADGSMIN